MAIINCPSCKNKVSDKAKTCSNCDYDFVNKETSQGLNEEQLASKQRMAHIKMRYSLQMQAMVAIILVLAASLLWYFGGRNLSNLAGIASIILLIAGAGLYLTTRVRLIIFKKGR